MSVATTTAVSAKVSSRLVNSMTPCTAYSDVGVELPGVHRGQVGQPSPDEVSRTAPPVTTIAALAMTLASASRLTVRTLGRFTPSA
jgi:hypothetical protein